MPARYRPASAKSIGRTFGCASWKSPSSERGTPRTRARRSVPSDGWIDMLSASSSGSKVNVSPKTCSRTRTTTAGPPGWGSRSPLGDDALDHHGRAQRCGAFRLMGENLLELRLPQHAPVPAQPVPMAAGFDAAGGHDRHGVAGLRGVRAVIQGSEKGAADGDGA